jgi:crotonobetainyl-CoA:carnitine CoA-transferase CaiB-like acyl-CoA transferase
MVGERDWSPLCPYGEQADQLAGLNAAIATLLATRVPHGQRVVVSGQAAVAASIEFGAITYLHTGEVPARTGSTHPLAPHTLFAAGDGLLAGGLGGSPRMWDGLLAWLTERGEAGSLAHPRWQDPAYRIEHRDEIFAHLAGVVGQTRRDEFFHAGQARRLPWAAVLEPGELTDNAQLAARDFFVTVHTPAGPARDVGFAARVAGARPPATLRVPAVGEHRKDSDHWRDSDHRRAGTPGHVRPRPAPSPGRRGTAAGIRVLDLTWVLAGPYATKILADHGAEVIKVESRHRPDPTRFSAGFHLSGAAAPGPDTSGYFNNFNRNKLSITVNLRTERGRELVLRLAERADVVVENFAAGVLDRLGLGFAQLSRTRPDIVVVSMSGMGHTGPWRDYVSYADAVSALSGWTALTGEPGRSPVGVVFGLADIIAGHHAALAALAALEVRDRTGAGQHVDLAQLEAAAAHLGDAVLRAALDADPVRPLGNRHPRMAPHGVFGCLAGEWVALAVRDDDEFGRLATAMGLRAEPRWATLAWRKADEDELESRVAAWTGTRTPESVAETLQRQGVPAYPVRDGRTLVERDANLRAWGFYVPLAHPAAGTFAHEGLPVQLARDPGSVRTPAPLLGQHTASLLTELLGLTEPEVDNLRAEGTLE